MPEAITTEHHTIPVLYEDDDVIALDKPEKLASIPERNPQKISLLRLIQDARRQKFYVVHRLDKLVSGVILFARNAPAHRCLNRQFEQRLVKKSYLALVHGSVAMESGAIDTPLRRFGSGRMGEDREKGKACLTEYSVQARSADYTRVEVHPLTGRKHQIRAHFFILGHPVVGDPLYGDKALQRTYPRLMLHALNIQFDRPAGERVRVESQIPRMFLQLMEAGLL
jgi:RluA family pseudouridine synthase